MANRPIAIKSSRRIQCSSASVRTTWQYCQDAIQCSTSNRVSVSDTEMGRQLQIVRTMWCSRLDAILGKASRAAEVQPSGRAFESVWAPCNVLQINIEDVRTSKQHRPDARSISIQQRVCFQKSTLFGKSLQAVWTTWQRPVVQNIPEFRSYAEGILAKTVRTLSQAVQT
jgi:hypothetical protein